MARQKGVDLGLAADIGLHKVRTDGFVGRAQRQQDQHGGHAGAVFAAGAVEQDRRFAGFQRPEQLLVGLIAEQHLSVHPVEDVLTLPGGVQLAFDVPGGKGDLIAVGAAQRADLHQPGAVRHIVRLGRGLGSAAQVEDEPQTQRVQQGTVSRVGEQPGAHAAADLAPRTVLPSSAG